MTVVLEQNLKVGALPMAVTSNNIPLDTSEGAFGILRDSTDVASDVACLRKRLADDGYLFLPGYLNREKVLAVRCELVRRLADAGLLAHGTDPMESISKPGENRYFMPELAHANGPLLDLIYGEDGDVMTLFADVLGGAVRHFDYTWMRALGPGGATKPHCDIVYMGRGTTNLYTAWIPYSDISWEVGGLIVLEDSHKCDSLRNNYGRKDVDAWCTNRSDGYEGMGNNHNIGIGGCITDNAARIRARMGGRWLSAQYQMGDILIFSMYTVHASLDNKSTVIRLSSDSRYQLASEPVDERWVGELPIGHGENAAKGIVC